MLLTALLHDQHDLQLDASQLRGREPDLQGVGEDLAEGTVLFGGVGDGCLPEDVMLSLGAGSVGGEEEGEELVTLCFWTIIHGGFGRNHCSGYKQLEMCFCENAKIIIKEEGARQPIDPRFLPNLHYS